MINATNLLMLISATLLLGYLGDLLYSKTKIPDIIWLLAFGVLIGPILNLYDPSLFLQISPLMSAAALAIILFDAGINMDIDVVQKVLPKSVSLAVFNFLLSVIFLGFFLHFFMPETFTLLKGFLLGAMVGGTGTVEVLSILLALGKILDITSSKDILTLESTLAGPITVVATITLIKMIMSPAVSLEQVTIDLVFAFGISSLIGLIIGLIWATILDRLFGRPLNYMITMAMLFLTYLISEEIAGQGAGPVAGLLFGLVLTNFSGILEKMGKFKTVIIDKENLRRFHEEITFFIKSFFFVYIGLVVSISLTHLTVGLILVGICLVVREVTVAISGSLTGFTEKERILSGSVAANGFPALIMSQLPAIYDPTQQYFGNPGIYSNLAFFIVLGTVLYGSLVGPYLARKKLGTSGETQVDTSPIKL